MRPCRYCFQSPLFPAVASCFGTSCNFGGLPMAKVKLGASRCEASVATTVQSHSDRDAHDDQLGLLLSSSCAASSRGLALETAGACWRADELRAEPGDVLASRHIGWWGSKTPVNALDQDPDFVTGDLGCELCRRACEVARSLARPLGSLLVRHTGKSFSREPASHPL